MSDQNQAQTPFPFPSAQSPKRPSSRWIHFEDALIILCIFALWPVILGRHTAPYFILLGAALGLQLVIVVLRVRRLLRVRRAAREDQERMML